MQFGSDMEAITYILIAVLIAAAIFLVVAVLLQKTKEDGLSSTIAGGAETFYGKESGGRTDKLLHKLTAIVGIVFVVAVLVIYIIQPDYNFSAMDMDGWKEFSSYHDAIFH